MTAEHLLQELETFTYTARIRRMVELGRAAAHDPQIAAILMTLELGDFSARFLALHSCFGSADGAHVLRALTDPSRIIRGVAIDLIPLACDEAQLQQALTIVPRDGRRALLWKLRHSGHDALIDAFLEQLATTNDPDLRPLLPYGSPTLVRQHIVRIQPFMRLVDWRRLTRSHPAIAFELLQTWAEATADLNLHLVACANGILPILSQKEPDLALALVKTLARSVPLSRLDLTALLTQRPAELADLLLQARNDPGEIDLSAIAHKLDDRRLLALQEKYPTRFEIYQPQWWFRRIAPERRAALYAVFAPSWRDRYGIGRISPEIVALLPRPQREQEGRRLLALPALVTHPEERLVYAAFLPWEEACQVLDPYLHDPGEKVRMVALQALVRLARYEHAHLLEVLETVCAHLNEPERAPARHLARGTSGEHGAGDRGSDQSLRRFLGLDRRAAPVACPLSGMRPAMECYPVRTGRSGAWPHVFLWLH